MDYEFSTDLTGRYSAQFSMGHEALGNWLSAEIGDNAARIKTLFEALLRLQQRQAWEFQLEGREYSLELSREEATVRAHALFAETDEFSEELEYYDSESLAQCGLDDFKEMLSAWCQFIGLSLSVPVSA
ncbi:MAG: YacL family protein [Halopseudomonas sp.]